MLPRVATIDDIKPLCQAFPAPWPQLLSRLFVTFLPTKRDQSGRARSLAVRVAICGQPLERGRVLGEPAQFNTFNASTRNRIFEVARFSARHSISNLGGSEGIMCLLFGSGCLFN